MINATTFHSCFAEELNEFLTIKETTLGESAFSTYRFDLSEFDTYLTDNGITRNGLTEDVVVQWIASFKRKLHSSTIQCKVSSIRGFIKYLHANGIHAYLPPIIKHEDDYIPHIFSEEELELIFKLADSMPDNKNQPDKDIQLKYPTMLRMLYGCGFRLGEVRNLKMGDIDLELGTVRLRNTKFNVERLVPMHPSLVLILKKYCCLRGIIGSSDEWVFPGVDNNKPISERVVRRKFETILKNAGISIPGREFRRRGVCLHCFRHSFAVRSFKKGEKEGRHLDMMVPFLSIYLGHKSLRETEKYLKFDATEIYPEVMDPFIDFTEGMFPEVNYDEE